MQLPLAADSFVCKLARAWLHIDHATPQWTAEVKLTWTVRIVADKLVKLTWAVGPPTDRPGQVRQEITEHPLGALLRAHVGAFAARFAASRGGAVHEGGASCGDDCGADRGGNSSCVGGDGGGEGRSIYLSRSLRLTGSDLEAAECKDELLSLNDFLEVTAIRASASVHASH